MTRPVKLLPIGSTYAHWKILEYIGHGLYLVGCPICSAGVKLKPSSMEGRYSCAKCKGKRRVQP